MADQERKWTIWVDKRTGRRMFKSANAEQVTVVPESRALEAERERDHLSEMLNEQREKWSFDTLMYAATVLLREWYPPDIIPAQPHTDEGDPGPHLVRALRRCIEARSATLGTDDDEGGR